MKHVFVLWAPQLERDEIRRRLLDEVGPALLDGAQELWIDAVSGVPSPNPFPLTGARMCGVVNLRGGDPQATVQLLRDQGFTVAGYAVEESVYRDYGGNRHGPARDWPDGTQSPGATAVTLLERPSRLDREEWVRRWHGGISPVSEAIQPRVRYVRNLVLEAITADAPPYEGIVEEVFPSPRHITNSFLFFGAKNPWQLVRNMLRIMAAVTSFTSLLRVQTVVMTEHFLKTPADADRQQGQEGEAGGADGLG